MAISSRLVKLMGGEIWLESELDVGSQFFFTLPVEQTTQAPRSSLRNAVYIGGSTVLVVDDNETNCRILQEMLSSWGMFPTLAKSAEEGLRALRQAAEQGEAFSLVLSDVHMPEVDGFEFARQIRSDAAIEGTSIIMLTSGSRSGEAAELKQLEIAARLMKPVKQSEVFDSIVRVLGANGAERLNEELTPADDVQVDPLNILLAEDNLVNQKLALGVLQTHGHRVTLAENGREAVDLLAKDPFDLVLMDVQMPIMDGFEATRRIREAERGTGRHTAIVAMTAHAMEGDREQCIECGMDEYVTKPIRIAALMEKVAAVLHPAEPVQQRPCGQATSTEGTDQPIDWKKIDALVHGDANLMREILGVFLREIEDLEKAIEQAVGQDDAASLAKAAHALKGAAFSVGAHAICSRATALENAGRQESLASVKQDFAALTEELQAVHECIRDFLG